MKGVCVGVCIIKSALGLRWWPMTIWTVMRNLSSKHVLKPQHPPDTGIHFVRIYLQCFSSWICFLTVNLTDYFLPQIITMRDYVPKIIGTESLEDHVGPYCGYDPSVNPSVANVFSTAAFRFGHAAIPPMVSRLNESFQEHELFPSMKLHDNFFTPWRIIKEGKDSPNLTLSRQKKAKNETLPPSNL